MAQALRVVGLGGVVGGHSVSEMALRTTLNAAAAAGAATTLLGTADLELPFYNARSRDRSARQAAFVAAARNCNGLIISSPCYHGGISGLIKNALDHLEDLRTDDRVYLDGLAVGLIVCAGGEQGGALALASLRNIVHTLRGWPTPLGVTVNGGDRALFDGAGNCVDATTLDKLTTVGRQVVEHARLRSLAHKSGDVNLPLATTSRAYRHGAAAK